MQTTAQRNRALWLFLIAAVLVLAFIAINVANATGGPSESEIIETYGRGPFPLYDSIFCQILRLNPVFPFVCRFLPWHPCCFSEPHCVSHIEKKCAGNSVYWYDSCNNQQEVFQTCGANQTCSNAQCVNNCISHSVKQCVGSSIYWYNSCNQQEDLFQTCGANQACQNGQCVSTCTPHASKKCAGNSVHWYDSCNNQQEVFQNCSLDQLCENGQCIQNCTPIHASWKCVGNNSYWFDGCGNQKELIQDCTALGKTCQQGLCVSNCVSHSTLKCAGNDVFWFDSCGNQQELYENCGQGGWTNNYRCSGNTVQREKISKGCISFKCYTTSQWHNTTTCSANQACQAGQCANIICSNNSSCGTSGFTSSPFCQGNNVYQNYITYTCNNPGTSSSNCTNSTVAQFKNACASNQACSNGNCSNVACSSASDCGTSGYVGGAFCQNNNVYKNYKTYTCNNPGTPSSNCANSTAAQLINTCSSGQVCSAGQCANVVCSNSSSCGTSGFTGSPFCQGNSVYQNYITYTCNNPGTSSSNCTNSTVAQFKNACTSGQVCSNGSCSNVACNSASDCGTSGYVGGAFCVGNEIHRNYKTYTCNNPGISNSSCSNSTTEQVISSCLSGQACSGGTCSSVACSNNAACGTDGLTGNPFCLNNNVYKYYKTYTCRNPGTSSSYCTDSSSAQLINNCTSSQTCSNGSCSSVVCSSASDCGISGYVGDSYCQNNNVYRNYKTYICNNQGTSSSYCTNSTVAQLMNTCSVGQTCSSGSCSQNNLVVSCFATPNPAQTNQQVSFIASVSGGTGSYTYSWSGACAGTSQVCSNTFSEPGTKTATVSVTSGSQTTSSTCSAVVSQSCATHFTKQCVGNNVYWFNSCNQQEGLYQNCTSGQICSAGQCINNCTSHSATRCSSNNLYWYDSCGNQQELYQYCSNGCQNGYCNQQTNLYVSCYATPNPAQTNQQVSFIASVSGGTGSYTYSWSGACNLYSSYSQSCYVPFPQTGYYAANLSVTSGGQTATTTCQVNVGAGGGNCFSHTTTRCVGTNVYWYDSCGNQQELAQNCNYLNQTCQNGQCIQNCIQRSATRCVGNNLYWYDSCGNQQGLYQNCSATGQICQYGQCISNQPYYAKHYTKACYNSNLYWYDSKGIVNDLYLSCADSNQCTSDGCSSNKCQNELKCDGSTCQTGSDDYCNNCSHAGDGICNCGETNNTTPQDCKTTVVAATCGGADISVFCQTPDNPAQWLKNLNVSANQEINCMAVVKNSSSLPIANAVIFAQMPGEISYLGNLQINGTAVNGDLISGYNLGTIQPGISQTVNFKAKTQAALMQGVQQIIARITSASNSNTDFLSVNFVPGQNNNTSATASLQGPSIWSFLQKWFIWVLAAVVLIFLFVVIFRRLSAEQ